MSQVTARFVSMDLLTTLADDLDTLTCTRANMLRDTEHLTLAQVNAIPPGFHNNVVWNLAHCWVTQVLLVQGLAGSPIGLAPDFIAAYRKGSAPTEAVDQEAYDFIRQGLLHSQTELHAWLRKNGDAPRKPYTTSYGKSLTDVASALRFNNTHEGMHYGVVLAMRKLV